MKIEKLNENQIRCTLNQRDLIDRELKISELAYGSEKAKGLFRDMMNQAFDEFGFEAEDIPLVIEAIPVSGDCIVLIVTKVEDPEELDTRFSKFSPLLGGEKEDMLEDMDEDDLSSDSEDEFRNAEDILNLIKKISDGIADGNSDLQEHIVPISERAKKAAAQAKAAQKVPSSMRIFSFGSLDEVSLLAHVIRNSFKGQSTLYKNAHLNRYFLVLKSEAEDFIKVVHTASEFGKKEKATATTVAYFEEHYETLIRDKAVDVLSQL
ncbi:MAG TPA: adaptor protein MecA [Candidatus Scybalocola faecigallinarum]|uniref:Adaptor protein MecA n=1 Tax=Candidatus Scybalocola faecigallinarum TaxID=2840941 RepID=A0A9D1F5C7_9FIRM|nr:adaptor protein MecA [Candidatus Scybalocola faecigallinarum]